MEMDIKIHRPCVVIKDRHYLENALLINLGEIIISNNYYTIEGRF